MCSASVLCQLSRVMNTHQRRMSSQERHTCGCRFHYVPYGVRMWSCAALMSGAYTTVALSREVGWQLAGVVLSAVQGGLGEASCLAMCTFFDSRAAITLWSSGTGFAGEAMICYGLMGSPCTTISCSSFIFENSRRCPSPCAPSSTAARPSRSGPVGQGLPVRP